MGNRLCRALCGGVLRLCCLSLRLCAVDGEKARALRRPDLRSALPAGDRQHRAVRRPRCEREDVPGLAAVRLLPAPPLVDQSTACRLCFALADRGGTGLRLVLLDAATGGLGQWCVVGAVWDRRPDVVQRPLARPRLKYCCLY